MPQAVLLHACGAVRDPASRRAVEVVVAGGYSVSAVAVFSLTARSWRTGA